MKEKILLDIDGVIADFYKEFASYINEHLGAGLDPDSEPEEYSMHRWGHDLPKNIVSRQIPLWIQSGGYKRIPIYPKAKEFVYILMDKYDVHIVTARIGDFSVGLSQHMQDQIRRDTLGWFKLHGIPANKVFFEHEKIDFCKKHNIGVIIEDKIETAFNGAQEGMDVILINRGWNQSKKRIHPNIKIAYNYKNAINFLEEMFG